MNINATSEILHSIGEATLGRAIRVDAPFAAQLQGRDWSAQLSSAISAEFGVSLVPDEIQALRLTELSTLVESRLKRDLKGQSLIDFYARLKQLASDAIYHEINYGWFSTWEGDLFNESDSLERAEIVIHMEEEFGFSIPDQDAHAMQTVAQTVRYLWGRSCQQDFRLRDAPDRACRKAHIFYELRRLLVASGGVPLKTVRLDARIGDLIPTWHWQFTDQVQKVFQVDLRKRFFGNNLRKTSVRDLVNLIFKNAKQPQ